MGWKLGVCSPLWGGAGSLSKTMWLEPGPTSMPSFILIHPAIWPQYANVTDIQDRTGQTGEWSDSIRRTILQMVAEKRFALSYQTIVCLSVCLSVLPVLSVCNVGVLWPKGWMDQVETWHRGKLGSSHIVLDRDPAPPHKGLHTPNFHPMSLWPNGWMD